MHDARKPEELTDAMMASLMGGTGAGSAGLHTGGSVDMLSSGLDGLIAKSNPPKKTEPSTPAPSSPSPSSPSNPKPTKTPNRPPSTVVVPGSNPPVCR